MVMKNTGLIIEILTLLCPYLKEMAERTDNKVDDFVVHFICRLLHNVESTVEKEDFKP